MKLAIQQIITRGSLHLFWMFVLAIFASPLASAVEVRGEQVSQADISMLTPVCKLIMIENPNVHLKAGGGPLPGDAPLFERPGYGMGKDNPHLHHYCWALVHKMRYFRAGTAHEKDFRFSQFIGDIDYVLRKSRTDWPYFHVLLVDQAEMMKMRGDYPYSILKIDEALRHKPDYERAYALKSDVYLAMGDKKKAADAAQEGLDKIPRSKFLRWRLEQLGVKVPPPPEPDADSEKENESDTETEAAGDSATAEQANETNAPDSSVIAAPDNDNETGQGAETRPDTPIDTDSAGKDQDKPETETDGQPKNNPYCRFCP